MKGKLIVIEGSDGSGKTTQLNLLKDYFLSAKIPFEIVDFPRYNDSFYGKILKKFLMGEYGSLNKTNPYLASVIFSLDRLGMKEEMYKWLNDEKIILANRYVASNMAHQAGRLLKEKREEFIRWDEELEYEANKIPKEDLVIFLNVPYQISEKLLRGKAEKDMVEKDSEYLKNAQETYLFLAKYFPHWATIDCFQNGQVRNREDIHEEILQILREKKIL